MSAIITKYVADYKLNKDMSNEELSQHALVLLELLTDKLKRLKDVKAISRALVETSTDAIVALSRLSRLRRELRTLNASKEIISATLILEITRASNKIQQERTEQRKNEGLHYLDHFSLESVKERLDAYDVSNTGQNQGKHGISPK
ncbi:hypothetical protein C1646_771648 [Rhizophagus diaphanus]|nr:hypothetical protein C1646_771648 [Rhizophagus diaphanus] [Rhizophagus sp. MUCL 43196]